MSLRELLDYSRRMRRLGVPVTPLIVAAHAKTSYPFTNVVLCALGIPIALRLRRSPKAVSFCVAMVLSFFYLWVMELAKALGAKCQRCWRYEEDLGSHGEHPEICPRCTAVVRGL